MDKGKLADLIQDAEWCGVQATRHSYGHRNSLKSARKYLAQSYRAIVGGLAKDSEQDIKEILRA